MSYAVAFVKSLPVASPVHKAILIYFAEHAGSDGLCHVSQAEIADESGFSIRTIRTALDALEASGFVSRSRQKDDRGTRSADRITLIGYADFVSGCRDLGRNMFHAQNTTYRQEMPVSHRQEAPVTIADVDDVTHLDTSSSGMRQEAPVTYRQEVPVTHPSPSFLSPIPPIITTPSLDANASSRPRRKFSSPIATEFESAWREWPQRRRSSKRQSLAAWGRRHEAGDVLLSAVRLYLASKDARKDGGEFVPAMERWLRDKLDSHIEALAERATKPTQSAALPQSPDWWAAAAAAIHEHDAAAWRSYGASALASINDAGERVIITAGSVSCERLAKIVDALETTGRISGPPIFVKPPTRANVP